MSEVNFYMLDREGITGRYHLFCDLNNENEPCVRSVVKEFQRVGSIFVSL